MDGNQPHPIPPKPCEPVESMRDRILLGVCLACSCVMMLSLLWLQHAVPVSEQDLKDASWLAGYSTLERFSGMSAVFGVVIAFMGIAIGMMQHRMVTIAFSVVLGSTIFLAGRPSVQFIAAVDANTAKVGCFVWESKECRAMLGLHETGTLPSMYVPREEADRTGDVYAGWYNKALADARSKVRALSVSGTAIAPLLVFHTDELNAKLNAQRAEVARQRAAAH
ncbi:hypothetical protein [Burkholderia ambifaria]|uniref:hypothetical protein n=1 Tax=Burkholderia ambifaria TaxID=152480 RepID=UPI000F7FFAC1|nr:hypothetical protein [Burkholderia ambifaria]